jgi:hypothetical protein
MDQVVLLGDEEDEGEGEEMLVGVERVEFYNIFCPLNQMWIHVCIHLIKKYSIFNIYVKKTL